jgi:NADPH:quinone reductase-like Zn-dependent oxidoreductase
VIKSETGGKGVDVILDMVGARMSLVKLTASPTMVGLP